MTHLPNKFVEWDQDRLRILWMAGIPNFLRKTPADGESYPRQASLEIIAAVVKHLSNGFLAYLQRHRTGAADRRENR